MDRQEAGRRAEQAAARWLIAQGLVLLETNFRRRVGEIDLIMQHGSVVVFVEVRQRRHIRFGGAAASVTSAKQRRLILTAGAWLARRPPIAARIDVVCVRWHNPWLCEGADFDWIKNAVIT